jgi:hypothetical protein
MNLLRSLRQMRRENTSKDIFITPGFSLNGFDVVRVPFLFAAGAYDYEDDCHVNQGGDN